MKKLLTGLVAAAAFALPAAAFASVNVSNVLFDNGTGNVTVSAGSDVNVHLYVNTSGSNDVESVFVKFPGAGGAAGNGVCYNVDDQVGASPINGWVINFNVKAPVNSGVWPIEFSTHGTNGDDADQGCFTSADTTNTFNGRVTVEANNSNGSATQNSGGGSTGSATNTPPGWFCAVFPNITACGGGSTPAPAPTTDIQCAAFAAANVGTQPNVYNSGNIALQGYLLSQHMSIPALTQGGAAFGFYGNQTTAAVGQWRSMHPTCN